MKLIYVYIKDYRVLKNVNFNLGGKYRFNYNSNSEKINYEINNQYLDGFYEVLEDRQPLYAHIKHVSALVGENGTGKSTFMDFIKDNFIEGVSGFHSNCIIAFEDYDNGKVVMYISNQIKVNEESIKQIKNQDIEIKNYGPKDVIPSPELQGLFKITQPGDIPEANEVHYIYLSNIFDKKEEVELSGLYNISTNFLLKEDTRGKFEMGIDINNYQLIEQHRFSEINREIDFINGFKDTFEKYLNFKLPTELIGLIVDSLQFRSQDQIFETKAYVFMSSLKESLTRLKKQSNYVAFLWNLFYRSIENVLSEYYRHFRYSPFSLDLLDENNVKLIDERYIYHINSILEYLIELTKNFEPLKQRFISIREMFKFFFDYISPDNYKDASELSFNFHISTKQEQELFFLFYRNYKNTFLYDAYLNFTWADRSTGEKALLNIYSRLYYLSDMIIRRRGENLILRKNIVLMIDEGELYLHPTWQKEVLLQLFRILPIIFINSNRESESRNIQIIFTSNSPLLISDIPKNNIVFLKKGNNGNVMVQDSLNDQKQTFGANIHTLLSDSFFMQSGMMGDFAMLKINYVIDLLLGDKETFLTKRREIETIIEMIGEPVIKSKLIKMLSDKMIISFSDMNERIDGLENRINNLEDNI